MQHVTLTSPIFAHVDFGTPDKVNPISEGATHGQQERGTIPLPGRDAPPVPPVTDAPPRSSRIYPVALMMVQQKADIIAVQPAAARDLTGRSVGPKRGNT